MVARRILGTFIVVGVICLAVISFQTGLISNAAGGRVFGGVLIVGIFVGLGFWVRPKGNQGKG